jgi:hypothetical protein
MHGRFQILPPYRTLRTSTRGVAPLLGPIRSFVVKPIGVDRYVDPPLDALTRHVVPNDRTRCAERKIYSSFAGHVPRLLRQIRVTRH